MAKINCLTHFDSGKSGTFDSDFKYKCDSTVERKEQMSDFGMRAIEEGEFDVATESIGVINADHFNPKTFACLLMLDDGNEYRTNRKMLFCGKWRSVGVGVYVRGGNVFWSVAWMGKSSCLASRMKDILERKKLVARIGIQKSQFKAF
jgi:hypothetical protein